MRTLILLLSFTLCPFSQIYAQRFLVNYEVSTRITRTPNLTETVVNPQIRAVIERNRADILNQNRSTTAQLIVNNGISIYKSLPSDQQIVTRVESNLGEHIRMIGSIHERFVSLVPHTIYKNHSDHRMLSQASVDGKEYLIEQLLTDFKWQTGNREREILGYVCIEATSTERDSHVTAWYAPDIPVSDGPSYFWGLPGLILHLDMGDGYRVFSCTSIKEADNLLDIIPPREGEKMSKEQFDNMVLERIEQMINNSINRDTLKSSVRIRTTIVRDAPSFF